MDGDRFDAIARALVTASSRRRLARGAAAGTVAGALGWLGWFGIAVAGGALRRCRETCAGCCDGRGNCQPGTGDGSCGVGGADCAPCRTDLAQRCAAIVGGGGRCLCDIAECATLRDGCCDRNEVCRAGTTVHYCGRGGQPCVRCPNHFETCDLETRRCCRMAGTECEDPVDCCAGLDCFGGRCCLPRQRCGQTCCVTGCCDQASGQCKRGREDEACGRDGEPCENCAERHQRCTGPRGGIAAAVRPRVPAGVCVCDPTRCRRIDGCCDRNSTCQPGDQPDACGHGGDDCDDCTRHGAGSICQGKRCCRVAGEACQRDEQCCDRTCRRGRCAALCRQPNESCSGDAQCCNAPLNRCESGRCCILPSSGYRCGPDAPCCNGHTCVTHSNGVDKACCPDEQVCLGSRTGCCSPDFTCDPRVNPEPGTPTHACIPPG